MIFPGWTVARAIPYETYVGLLTGKYQLYGGVIRWAAGTANGGRIVAHLLPASTGLSNTVPGLNLISGLAANIQLEQVKSITRFNTYQLFGIARQLTSLTQTTQNVLEMATGAAVLSGLGLTVSSLSFVALNKKLDAIDVTLKQIQKDLQAIKQFLESTERAKLYAALNNLLKLDEKTAPEHRHAILHASRNTLGEINMRYRELLSEANTLEMAMAHEEYFSLTALAHTRCTAELGMFDIAYREIEEVNRFWQVQAHRIAKQLVVGEHPERLLATDFVEAVPVTELVPWLDFVYEERKGYAWLDELRLKSNDPWYPKGWLAGVGVGVGRNRSVGVGLEKELGLLIPALRKLVARSDVFEGYVAQYDLQQAQNLKPSEFERQVAELPADSAVGGYFILEAEKRAA